MSTRGAFGIRYKNEDKIFYNGHDSYPTGLGVSMILFLRGKSIEDLKKIFNDIDFDSEETFIGYENENIGYNNKDFLIDSLFCEFAYIINLDDEVLEIYTGFNKNPNEKGRYANKTMDLDNKKYSGGKYYGVKLVQTIPLKDVEKYKISDNKIPFVKKDNGVKTF